MNRALYTVRKGQASFPEYLVFLCQGHSTSAPYCTLLLLLPLKDKLAQPGNLRSSALWDIRGYWKEEYCNVAFTGLIKLLFIAK
jgi:hypothetical protein